MSDLKTTISTNNEVLVEYTIEKGAKGDGYTTPDDPTEFDINAIYAQDDKGFFTIKLDIHTLQVLGIMEELRITIEEEGL